MRFNYILILLFIAISVRAQVEGTITDARTGEKVIGASVMLVQSTIGTFTDLSGRFTLNANIGDTLIIRSLGYTQYTVQVNSAQAMNIRLEANSQLLDEVIVTGVFDPRKRLESSVAITTLSTKQLERIVSNSSAELLRNIPGVFVQSARGELRNQIFSRGMVFDGSLYMISLQEDGMPMISGQSGNPSTYLRSDIGLQKLEAVRGGSASILGVNAPGGIYNYISKTGGDHFDGMISTRIGLEGNGRNPYYRMDANIGGPLKKDKSLTYHIGGHFRHADGAKYPGYPLSRGGQIKGNIVKTYPNGSLKIYAKWLDDHTKDFEFTPTTDFVKPRPAGHFTNYSSVLIDGIRFTIPSNGSGVRTIDYDSKAVNHLRDHSLQVQLEHRLANNWKTSHNIKYTQKQSTDIGTFIVYPNDVTSFLFNAVFGILGNEGDYKLFNNSTKKVYGTLTHDFSKGNPFKFEGNLPGNDIISNGVFFTPFYYENYKINDLFYQGTISKVWNKNKITAGLYTNNNRFRYYSASASAGTGLSTIEDKPQIIGIEYTPISGGSVQQYTNPQGAALLNYGPQYASYNDIKSWDNAIYFGHQWDVSNRLNLDWGMRYEYFHINNTFQLQNANTASTTGGIDGNPNTLYDNILGSLKAPTSYSKTADAFSYSAGLNYTQNKNLAYYFRYSNGSKVPDISTFVGSQDFGKSANVLPITTVQIEGGIKYQSKQINATITPFVSILSGIPRALFASSSIGSDASFYNLPVLYNKAHAVGVELETNIQVTSHWNIRANAVFQQFYTDKFQTWDTRDLGPKDDTLLDQSGKKISYFAAPYIINITPSYQSKKVYVGCNWYTIAKRTANINEAFDLPAFSQIDLNLGYVISKRVNLKFTINNLLDYFGVMDWTAPIGTGIFFDTFNTDKVTKETIKANPNAIYYTMGIQPRSFFLDLTVKL